MRRSIDGNQQRHSFAIVGAIFWLGIGLTFGLLDTDERRRLEILSALTLTFGAWVFLKNGGRVVTTAGIFGLCVSIFVGFAGLYWAREPVEHAYIADAVTLAYTSLIASYYLFWCRTEKVPPLGPVNHLALRGSTFLGLLLMVSGTVGVRLGIASSIAGHAAFTGSVLLAASMILTGRRNRKLWSLLVAGAAALFYVEFVFVGYGRLILAALAFSILVIVTQRFRTYWIKILSLVMIPPIMVLLVDQREDFGVARYGQALDGIGSVIAPLEQFAVMLRDIDSYTLHLGQTFWAAAVTHVPRALWPDKPDGFGLVMAKEYDPALAAIGGTYAALSHGEWIYAFGIFGLVLMTLVFGWAVKVMDRIMVRQTVRGVTSRRALLAFVAIALIAGGVSDMVWGGSHTFTGRTGTRLLLVAALAVVWGGLLMKRRPSRTASRPFTT